MNLLCSYSFRNIYLDKHRSDHDRVEKVRERERERRSPKDDDRSRSASPDEPSNGQRSGTEQTSLSIEETNKLRAALGLKPLTVDGNSTADSDATRKGSSDDNFIHRAPENLTEKKRTEEITRKLNERKEARALGGKFL
jgi:U4/U6.U5 tri-snRNP-associated protein 1